MYCKICGREDLGNANFCAYCGARLSSNIEQNGSIPTQSQMIKKNKLPLVFAGSAFITVVLAVVLVIVLNSGGGGEYSGIQERNDENGIRISSDVSSGMTEDTLRQDTTQFPVIPPTQQSQAIPMPQVSFDNVPTSGVNNSIRWEYMHKSISSREINDELNSLSYEGWEPILYTHGNGWDRFVFRRVIP